MKKFALPAIFLLLSICFAVTGVAQTITGILPDKNAKPGTWSEWQTVKDSAGTEIAKYRIQLKSSDKFVGKSVACNFVIDVVSLTDGMMFVDLNYTYNQSLNGSNKTENTKLSGSMMKKNKSWEFKFALYTDNKSDSKDRTVPCYDCGFSYTLSFGVSKF